MSTEPLVLSVQEVADSLGVSRDVIYVAIGKGEIPARKIGGRIVVSRAWRDRFVAEIDAPAEAAAS